MTGNIPFQNLKNNHAITLSIFKGKLPTLDNHSRMLLIRRLGSLMIGCWRVDARARPTAEECTKVLRLMVSRYVTGLRVRVDLRDIQLGSQSALRVQRGPLGVLNPEPTS